MAIKLLELANKIFGRKKVSQQMGTKTGVKLLSGGKNDPFKGIYNVEMLKNNPKALEEAKKQLENNLGYAFSNKNTLEVQRFEKNLEAVDAAMSPKSADIIPFKKEGIETISESQKYDQSLFEQKGKKILEKSLEKQKKELEKATELEKLSSELLEEAKKNSKIVNKRTDDIATGDPTGETSDLMTKIESDLEKVKETSKKLKETTEGLTDSPFDDFYNYVLGGSKARDPRRGVVRAAAREILNKNKVNIGREDPIDVLRKMYGEKGLEAIDAVSDSLLDAQSYGEINTILRDNKLFDLVPKKTYGYDQNVVTAEKIRKAKEQEAKQKKILEDFDTTDRTKNAHGGLIDILKL